MPKGNYQHYTNQGFQKGNKINLGKILSKLHRKKISKANKGRLSTHTPEGDKKMRESLRGRKYPNRKSPSFFTEEHKQKIREANLGENNPNWISDRTLLLYPDDWTNDLKESIRKRDEYICQFCGICQNELNCLLDVHHIDYNKDNLDPKNLISLCRSCHIKTNYNRKYWIEYFKRSLFGTKPNVKK